METTIGNFEIDPLILRRSSIQESSNVFIVLRKAIGSKLTENQKVNNAFIVKVEDVLFSENGFKTTVETNKVKMNFLLEQQFQKGEMIQLTIEPANISIVQE